MSFMFVAYVGHVLKCLLDYAGVIDVLFIFSYVYSLLVLLFSFFFFKIVSWHSNGLCDTVC